MKVVASGEWEFAERKKGDKGLCVFFLVVLSIREQLTVKEYCFDKKWNLNSRRIFKIQKEWIKYSERL
jgi:hypothetical protein